MTQTVSTKTKATGTTTPSTVPPSTFVKAAKETEQQAQDRIEAKYLARATTPLKAIRAKCVQCVGVQPKLIASCKETSCALHPFRMGENTLHRMHKPRSM